MAEKTGVPCIFYFYVHYKLKERYGEKATLSIKKVRSFLFEWRIPRELRNIIVKEMEMLDLLKRIHKNAVELRKSNFNPNDLRVFYEQLGIF